MAIDIKASAPHIPLAPILFLRWLSCAAQAILIMASAGGIGIETPVAALTFLVACSLAVNIFSLVRYRDRRVPEGVMMWQLVFDVLQFSALLALTGGVENPFSILLLAPLAMAASLLSLFNLCLLIMLVIVNLGVMFFLATPLAWAEPAPYLTPQYIHSVWLSLLITFVIISFIIWRLAMEGRLKNEALKKAHGILEEKRRLTAIGNLAAAAVHELGSPLATIAIVARELERETHPDDPIADDIRILKSESEKCRRILADLAADPARHFGQGERLRFDRVLMEIASSSVPEGRGVTVSVKSDVPENLPSLPRMANLEYGLGNLISNAATFASTKVWIFVEGYAETIEIRIVDDGPGFGRDVLSVIGQPYTSTRPKSDGHMGLGIFIALNLLEAGGANVRFSNIDGGGACVRIIWSREALESAGRPV